MSVSKPHVYHDMSVVPYIWYCTHFVLYVYLCDLAVSHTNLNTTSTYLTIPTSNTSLLQSHHFYLLFTCTFTYIYGYFIPIINYYELAKWCYHTFYTFKCQ